MMNEPSKESAFLVTNASGCPINLLNDEYNNQQNIITVLSPPASELSDEGNGQNEAKKLSKRRHHCLETGCNKSFTTSGHLARHHRIHTGEKNFPCLFPGCISRFSRQDNMMQHYRTHMSPKSKKGFKKSYLVEELKPKLHSHQRIKSEYEIERPLTIDQHLNNYYRHHTPTPLVTIIHSKKSQQNLTFYQHKPLSYHNDTHHSVPFPLTLLHPNATMDNNQQDITNLPSPQQLVENDDTNSSQSSLLQLANIVSTFG